MEVMCFITEKAKEKGFCDAGVCSAEPFHFLRSKLENSRELLSGFVEKDLEKRLNPALTMPGVQSIIVLAKSYSKESGIVGEKELKNDNVIIDKENTGNNHVDSTELKKFTGRKNAHESSALSSDIELSAVPRGYISLGAVGEDYHTFMKRELTALAEELKSRFGGEYQCFSDTGPLVDRELALRSGIGYLGTNGSVITLNGGPMVFIGYILTTLSLPAGQAQVTKCDDGCGRCIKACPTGALTREGLDIKRCISYLTQLKRNLSLEETRMIGQNLYGCDCCLLACPKSPRDWEQAEQDDIKPRLEDILDLSNKGFQRTYGHTAMGWRGGNVIKRNALGALGNSGGKEALALLIKFAQSDNPFLRYGAVCGLINLGEAEGILFLEAQYIKEKDKQIKEVIAHGLLELKRTAGQRSGRKN